jgi:hypothetical protein
MGSLVVSKSITQQLSLGKILNSQQTASEWTQLRQGLTNITILGAFLAAPITDVSVMYKFSFVQEEFNGLLVFPT